jgi:hypothetical protein
MGRKFRKIEPPPIDPARRNSEGRTLWLGLLVAAAGAALVVFGLFATHDLYSAYALPGDVAPAAPKVMKEYQVVEAVTWGAVRRDAPATQSITAPPPGNDCPT